MTSTLHSPFCPLRSGPAAEGPGAQQLHPLQAASCSPAPDKVSQCLWQLLRTAQGDPSPPTWASTPIIPNFSLAVHSQRKLGLCGATDKPVLEVAPTPEMTQKPTPFPPALFPQSQKGTPAVQQQTTCHPHNWIIGYFYPLVAWHRNLQAAPLAPSSYIRYFPSLFATPGRGNSLAKVLTSLGDGSCPASPSLAILPALPLHPTQHWQISLVCATTKTSGSVYRETQHVPCGSLTGRRCEKHQSSYPGGRPSSLLSLPNLPVPIFASRLADRCCCDSCHAKRGTYIF